MDYDYERPANKRSWNSHNYLVTAKKGKRKKFPAIILFTRHLSLFIRHLSLVTRHSQLFFKLVTFHHSPGNPLLAMTGIEKKWGLCKALKSNFSRMKA